MERCSATRQLNIACRQCTVPSTQPPSTVSARCTAPLGNVVVLIGLFRICLDRGGVQYIAHIPAIIFSGNRVSLLQCSS